MFDELFPEASDTALTARLNRPPTPQAPRFSTWGLFAAAPKGVAAGASEAIGSTADMLGAYGSVMGTTGVSAGGMFSLPTPEERKQQIEATDKLLSDGPDYMSEGGRSFRNVAKDYTPDPITTHMAEGAVFNLFRMGSKAITAAATMGNIPGAVVAGAEEGFTMADQLAQQGVDIGTRTQVGAVNAVVNAAGFALPAAGKTWMQTGALALVGGPASFVAQQAATKEILQAADYTQQADQYDPLDPVGLALSTVIPLGFGALAMRGAKVRGQTVPDAAPVVHPPDEVVDAARVSLVRQHIDATNPVPGDLAASDAHVKAYTQAMDQMAAGERVRVDVPENVANQASAEMAARIKPIEASQPVQIEIKPESNFMAAKSDSGLVGGHVTDGSMRISTSEVSPDMRGQGEGIKLYTALIEEALAKGLRVFSDSTVESSAVRVYEALQRRGYEVKRLEGGTLEDGAAYGKGAKEPAFEVLAKKETNQSLAQIDTAQAATKTISEPTSFNPNALAAEASQLLSDGRSPAEVIGNLQAAGTKVSPELQNMLIGASEFGGRINDLVAQVEALKAQRGPSAQPFDLVSQAVDNLRNGVKVQAPDAPNPLESRLSDLTVRNPTALDAEIAVEFDATGKPTASMTLGEYLDMVKKEAAQDVGDASLLEVAANCFLSGAT